MPNHAPSSSGFQTERPAQDAAGRRPLRLWFVVAVCLLQATFIPLAVALLFMGESALPVRMLGQPGMSLAVFGGALTMAYLAAAAGLFARQAWAMGMANTLLILTVLGTVVATLAPAGVPEAERPMAERWADLAALAPMLALNLAAFAVLVLRNPLAGKRPHHQ